jgi:hypothetical protein
VQRDELPQLRGGNLCGPEKTQDAPMNPTLRAAAAAVLMLIASLAYAAAPPKGLPWSEITGERQSRSTLNRAGTVIKMVDSTPVIDRDIRLRPGLHVVVVQWRPRTGLRTSDRTLRVDLRPCKRYFVTAQFASPGSTLWQPVIDRTEDIYGCKVPVDLPPSLKGPGTRPRPG